MVDESIYSSPISSMTRRSTGRYGYGSARMAMAETNAFEVDLNGIEPCDWPLFHDEKHVSQSSSFILSTNATSDLNHTAWMDRLDQKGLDFSNKMENYDGHYKNVETRTGPAISRHVTKGISTKMDSRTSNKIIGTSGSKPMSGRRLQQGRQLVRTLLSIWSWKARFNM
jgi:hypothetical protein